MSNVTPPPPSSAPPPAPGAWGEEPPRPRLARRRTDKVLGGVCGGLADHLGVDATVVRVVAVLLAMTGWGVIVYLVAWAALPEADPNTPPVRRAHRHGGRGRFPWLPVVIVAVLLFSLPSGFSVVAGHGHFGNAAVPLLLLGGAAYLMWRATHGDLPRPGGGRGGPGHSAHRGHWGPAGVSGTGVSGGWQAPPPPNAPQSAAPAGSTVTTTTPAASPSAPPPTDPSPPDERPLWARADHDAGEPGTTNESPAAPAGDPTEGGDGDDDPLLAEARRLSDPFLTEPLLFETAPAEAPAAVPAATSPRRRGGARSALAALLIGAGVVGLAVAMGLSFSPFAVLAGVLVAIGAAMILGGLRGRSSRGLIIPGLIVLGLLSVTAVVDLPTTTAGERVFRPTTVTEIDDTYELGLGEMVIDLSEVDFSATDDIDIDADLGAGELRVYVPEDVDVVVHASASAGELHAFGETSDGFDATLTVQSTGGREAGEVTLDLTVNLGEIRVERA